MLSLRPNTHDACAKTQPVLRWTPFAHAGEDTSRQAVMEIRNAIREERETSVCLLNYKKDGTRFWNAFHLCPVTDANDKVKHFIGIQADVSHMFQGNIIDASFEQMSEEERKTAQEIAQDVKKFAERLHLKYHTCAASENVPSSLLTGLSTVQESFCLTDPSLPGNPMVYCSPGFLTLTGYTSSEILGNNCNILQGPGTDPLQVEKIRSSLDSLQPVSVVLKNYTKTGEEFLNCLHIAPVRDASGRVQYFCGVQSRVDQDEEEQVDPMMLLKQKGVVGAVRIATRGLSQRGLMRQSKFQTPVQPPLQIE